MHTAAGAAAPENAEKFFPYFPADVPAGKAGKPVPPGHGSGLLPDLPPRPANARMEKKSAKKFALSGKSCILIYCRPETGNNKRNNL